MKRNVPTILAAGILVLILLTYMVMLSPFILWAFILSPAWRSLRGGHWEWWALEQGSPKWFRLDECSDLSLQRPDSLCRRRPHCEEGGKRIKTPWMPCPGCERNLPLVPGAYSSDGETLWSCPCGEWSVWEVWWQELPWGREYMPPYYIGPPEKP